MFCAAASGGAQRNRTYLAATATTWLGQTLVDSILHTAPIMITKNVLKDDR